MQAATTGVERAVDRFARRMEEDDGLHGPAGGIHARDRYEHLLPVGAPDAGQQLAFRVDLDRCTGCKACVTACHSLNGLDADETWRDVGRLAIGGDAPAALTITTACHHCTDPACMSGCPVAAYEKDDVTGIVRHLDDQCFGCQYCVLKCPYDVPRYSASRGIVRKCDMCAQRLDVGEAPACAQGCPNEAISITIVEGADRTEPLLPFGAPPDDYTGPTTRYVTTRTGIRPPAGGALGTPAVRPSHPPLVGMLLGSQLAAGAALLGWLGALSGWPGNAVPALVVCLAAGAAAMLASLAHLGRPWLAPRAVIGLRTSWLSREVVAFGSFVALAGVSLLTGLGLDPFGLFPAAAACTAAAGMATVACSAMVYADTRRELWAMHRTMVRFFATVLAWGAILALILPSPFAPRFAAIGLAAAGLLRLCVEIEPLVHRPSSPDAIRRTAVLLTGPLHGAFRERMALGAATLAGLILLATTAVPGAAATTSFALLLAALSWRADWIERTLFFQAEAAPGMPREAESPASIEVHP